MKKPTTKSKHFRATDVRAAAQLATQATLGVTAIVEGVHQSVWRTLGFGSGRTPDQTRGITGAVYRSINGVTRLVGDGLDLGLGTAEYWLSVDQDDSQQSTPQRQITLAALNGILGDQLVATGNPLACQMTVSDHIGGLDLAANSPSSPKLGGKLLLLVHGLCMSDLQWSPATRSNDVDDQLDASVDYANLLEDALGYTPLYLRYNSGLHVSDNGQQLAAKLEQLITGWSQPIEELTIVAHSMGGLVARSALYYATQAKLTWPQRLKNLGFLGTPHHGAPLERAGNWLDVLLIRSRYSAPFGKLSHLRSAGITDLRYGYLVDEDWQERSRFDPSGDQRRERVLLPAAVNYLAVAATKNSRLNSVASDTLGDGLVTVASALGQHRDPRRNIDFSESSRFTVTQTNHMQLLHSRVVSEKLLDWLSPS